MAFLTNEQVAKIKSHMATDPDTLKNKYKSYSKEYDEISVPHNETDSWINKGFEVTNRTKQKTKLQCRKKFDRYFENKIWCIFYRLGFQILNNDEKLEIQWGDGEGDHKQIDVLAVGEDAIFVVECKAAEHPRQRSFKNEIDAIEHTREGITKALQQIYGNDKKVKFIFATENYQFASKSEDLKRLEDKKIFHFDDNTYKYVDSLITSYKGCALYQFYGLIFKNELINKDRIRIPALKGSMGNKTYYMLSIEPAILLKLGFVLHRTKVHKSMAPTYQRLLVPSRLKGIGNFIDKGGYFPNSIIVNFTNSGRKNSIYFEQAGKGSPDSDSRFGTLVIPNMYSIAYIIDGQHRLYGYANSDFKDTNTIPVVAFVDMDSSEQLKIFMEINENQKAIDKSLKVDLKDDLYWNSKHPDLRIEALRSSIIKSLGYDSHNILYEKITIGTDKRKLSADNFDKALKASSLLPTCSRKSYTKNTDVCMYDTLNLDFEQAMEKSQTRICAFINECYSFIQQKLDATTYDNFIECNRGTYGFITLIGSIHKYLVQKGDLERSAKTERQMDVITPFLQILAKYLMNIPEEDRTIIETKLGKGAEITWLRMFQRSIQKVVKDFNPDGLSAWLENQDKDLQKTGQEIGKAIISKLYTRVIEKAKELHGDRWESELSYARKSCKDRINEKEAADDSFNANEAEWTDFIDLKDVMEIINKNWTSKPEFNSGFVTFEKEYSINIGEPYKTKADKTRWLKQLNSCRDAWESSKGKLLTKEQVNILQIINESLIAD